MEKSEMLLEFINNMFAELKIPYFEIKVFKHYEKIFEYTIKPEAWVDKNKLYMYSCTKPLTAVCVMQLIETGKLSLDDYLVQYVPSFRDAFYIDDQGEKHVVGASITIRHLMTMSAGLDYDLHTPAIEALYRDGANPTTAEIVDAIAETPLSFLPGTQFQYSLCLDVMARVVEVVSQMRFSDYVQKYVFAPLGMTASGFRDNDPERMIPQYRVKKGNIEPCLTGNEMVRSVRFDSGGAGLVSTVADYAKLGVALANRGMTKDGYRLLMPESIEAMRGPEIQVMHIENGFTCAQGDAYSYGLGVRTRIVPTDFGLGIGEFGWDGAAGSYLMVDPHKNISVVMGMHLLGWPGLFLCKHLEIVEQIYKTFDFDK